MKSEVGWRKSRASVWLTAHWQVRDRCALFAVPVGGAHTANAAVVFVNHPSRGCVIRDTVVVRGPALAFAHPRIDVALLASRPGDDVADWNLPARVSRSSAAQSRHAMDTGERCFAVLVRLARYPGGGG